MMSKIEFGYRGEGISFSLPDRAIYLWFSWINGSRIYTETIAKWEDGSVLTAEEKKELFIEVLRYVREKIEKPIIVININDPSRVLWDELCSKNELLINHIEYTSKEEQFQNERKMYLEFIDSGKKVNIDGVDISNEKDLDDFLKKRKKNKPTSK